jgi:flagellar motor switch protein FliG
MEIQVLKDGNGDFFLSFDDIMITLPSAELKQLLIQIIQAYGGADNSKFSPEEFFERLKKADDVSLQTLIQVAENDDLVALVKLSENDKDLQSKLFKNMSDNSRKNFVEDAGFKFAEGSNESQLNIALLRLTLTCNSLSKEKKAKI